MESKTCKQFVIVEEDEEEDEVEEEEEEKVKFSCFSFTRWNQTLSDACLHKEVEVAAPHLGAEVELRDGLSQL